MRSIYLTCAATLLVASSAVAGGLPSPKKRSARAPESRTVKRVRAAVVAPMNQQFERRYMFSRARVMPPRRSVQTLARRTDRDGREFVPFTVVSEARGVKAKASGDVLTGCYYPSDDRVYLDHGGGAIVAAKHPHLTPGSKAAVETGRCVADETALSRVEELG